MAIQAPTFEPFGSLDVKVGDVKDSSKIPVDGMDMVLLTKGVLQWQKVLDKDGKELKDDGGNIKWIQTNQRGVRVIIKNGTVDYSTAPNIPMVWLVGETFKFNPESTYTFLDGGSVTYGKVVTA